MFERSSIPISIPSLGEEKTGSESFVVSSVHHVPVFDRDTVKNLLVDS